MDIAYFISDLLGQQGELSVPNLGYFVQIREKAFYDEENKNFSPPSYSVQFDPQVIDDDDTLAAYITDLKKISLASAKYFIEKYIANLKSQVIIEDVPFANLGSFSSDGVKLIFQSGTKNDDPSFFAFPPIEAYKLDEQPIENPASTTEQPIVSTTQQPEIEPAAADTPPPVMPVEDAPVNTDETSEEYIEDDEPVRSTSMWIILLIVIAVLAIAFAVVYKLRPDLLKAIFPKNTPTEIKATATPVPIKKIDTLNAQATTGTDTIIKPDTVKKPTVTTQKPVQPEAVSTTAATPAVNAPVSQDSVTKGSWVIRVAAFPTKPGADRMLYILKSKGFSQARLETTNVKRGNNYKVILGVYKTREEANSAKQDLLATGKIKSSEIPIEQIKK